MARITGTILTATGTPFTGTVNFYPDTAVKLLDDGQVTGAKVSATVTDGVLSQDLVQGAYLVDVVDGATNRFRIVVPDSGDSVPIGSIVSSGAAELPSVEYGVTSFKGRTGAVTPAAGDYGDEDITAAANPANYTPAAATVEGHLAGIDEALAGSGTGVDSFNGRTGAVSPAAGDYGDEDITAAATPANYTPAAATVEGHLLGIDAALAGLGGSSVWGGITGTLGNQVDLQAALDGKLGTTRFAAALLICTGGVWTVVNDGVHVPFRVSTTLGSVSSITRADGTSASTLGIEYSGSFSALHAAYLVGHRSGVESGLHAACASGLNNITLTLYQRINQRGRLYWNGAAWAYDGDISSLSGHTAFDGDIYVVWRRKMLYPQVRATVVGNKPWSILPVVNTAYPWQSNIDNVLFYNTSGVLQSTPNTNMDLYISRNADGWINHNDPAVSGYWWLLVFGN